MCGLLLASGLRESDRLSDPIFTPSTKATSGHDENISFDQVVALVGGQRAEELRAVSLDIYRRAAVYAEPRGILLADTKFEFGLLEDELLWIDEALTPDSSRFWPAEGYRPAAPSRRSTNSTSAIISTASTGTSSQPGPELPQHVAEATRDKYREAYRLLTGRELA